MIGSAGDHDIGIGSDSGGTKRTMAFSRPDTFSYNNMLNLYANKGDAQSAEAMLLQMQMHNSVGEGGACADVYSYSIVINAFQKRFTSSGPNGRDRKDLARAEELLSTLATKYEQSGFCDTTLRPTNVTFGTIISMYAQADRMARMDPDGGDLNGHKTRKWKATMLTKANDEEGNDVGWGAVNAERVLNWMIGLGERERLSKNAEDSSTSSSPSSSNINTNAVDRKGMICPTTYNFATVLDAWAKAGKGVEGARRCQALLDRLVSLYDKWDHIELRPIPLVRTYNGTCLIYNGTYLSSCYVSIMVSVLAP
jgi:pentatricopeptide repeat protein